MSSSLHERRRSASCSGGDEDDPSSLAAAAVAATVPPGGGGREDAKHDGGSAGKAGMTVDTCFGGRSNNGSGRGGGGRYGDGGERKEDTASGRAEKRELEDEDGDGHGAEDRRTSSPTSVTDFALSAAGVGGSAFPALRKQQPWRHQQEPYDDKAKPVENCASGSGNGGAAPEEDGASEVVAATPAGGGGGGGPRTSAEFMSAQALFGESIPGLTSFGECIYGLSIQGVRPCRSFHHVCRKAERKAR